MADTDVTTSPGVVTHVYWPYRDPSHEVTWQRPSTPVVVFCVGGGWEIRKPCHPSYERMCRVLANRGLVVLIPGFRRSGLGRAYYWTLWPVQWMMVWITVYCLLSSRRFARHARVRWACMAATVFAIVLGVVFWMGAESHPVSVDDQADDCARAVEWTQTNSFASLLGFRAKNVFVLGYSSGSNLACAVHSRSLPCVKGCITICGAYDETVVRRWVWLWFFWQSTYGKRTKDGLPIHLVAALTATAPDTAATHRPIAPTSTLTPAPVMLVVGEHESPTLMQSALVFATELIRARVPTQLLVMPGKDHWSALDDFLYEPNHLGGAGQWVRSSDNSLHTHMLRFIRMLSTG